MVSEPGPGLTARVETDGWAMAGAVLAPAAVAALERLFTGSSDDGGSRVQGARRSAGARNSLWTDPLLADLSRDRAVLGLVEPVLGPGARAVRVILFDKTPADAPLLPPLAWLGNPESSSAGN